MSHPHSVNLLVIRRQVLGQLRGPLATSHTSRHPPVPRWHPPSRPQEKTNLDSLNLVRVAVITRVRHIKYSGGGNTPALVYSSNNVLVYVHMCFVIHTYCICTHTQHLDTIYEEPEWFTSAHPHVFSHSFQGAPLSSKAGFSLTTGGSAVLRRKRVQKLAAGMAPYSLYDRLTGGPLTAGH